MIRKYAQLFTLPVLVLLAACGGDDKKADDALKQDLSLAAQAYPYQPVVSPMEQGYANGYGGYAPGTYTNGGYQPAVARYPTRTTSRASSGTIYRSSGTVRSTRVIKNTKRDAIIGAAAGAVLGGVTSHDRLKGAVLGGVAGGILGAVIGNNVDKKRVPY